MTFPINSLKNAEFVKSICDWLKINKGLVSAYLVMLLTLTGCSKNENNLIENTKTDIYENLLSIKNINGDSEINVEELLCYNVEDLESETEILVSKIFREKTIKHSGVDRELLNKWKNRILGKDLEWDTKNDWRGKKNRESIVEWFKRMVESGGLAMIMKKCDEYNVPYDAIFLALAESGWDANATSVAGAVWAWQFMEGTGKWIGLIKSEWSKKVDNRRHIAHSTDAAMKLLCQTKNEMLRLDRINWVIKMSESDIWYGAFQRYNWWVKLVHNAMINAQWKWKNYPRYCENPESKNYVPCIVWIRAALEDMYNEQNITFENNKKKSKADHLLCLYWDEKSFLNDYEKKHTINYIESVVFEEYCNKYIDENLYKILSEKLIFERKTRK